MVHEQHGIECHVLTACAVRLDGDAARVDDDPRLQQEVRAAIDEVRLPGDSGRQLRVFYFLQRQLMKWSMIYDGPASPGWRAFRTLFLLCAHLDVPVGLRNVTSCETWDREWKPRLSESLSLVAAVHASMDYAIPFGLSAVDPRLRAWRCYYGEEWSLFNEVHRAWHFRGYLDTDEFMTILKWKASRAALYHTKRLTSGGRNLTDAVKQLTQEIHSPARTDPDLSRLGVLMGEKWKLLLPTASAILTIYDPLVYSPYDVRSCETLQNPEWKKLGNRVWSPKLDSQYTQFITAVRALIPTASLRDADRYAFGKSV